MPIKRKSKIRSTTKVKAGAKNAGLRAVIRTGGKQYLVKVGQKLKVEKLEIEPGKPVVFDQVLLLDDGKNVEIGTPIIAKAKVTANVLKTAKGDKVMIFKYKPKKRSKKKQGHRQFYTEVEITSIG